MIGRSTIRQSLNGMIQNLLAVVANKVLQNAGKMPITPLVVMVSLCLAESARLNPAGSTASSISGQTITLLYYRSKRVTQKLGSDGKMGECAIAEIDSEFELWRAQGKDDRLRHLVRAVVSGLIRCYVLGRNPSSRFIVSHLPVAGFVDDQAAPGESWHGLPVFRGDDVPAGSIVINAVLFRRPITALNRLAALPTLEVLHYSDFERCDPDSFPVLPFVSEARAVFADRRRDFRELANRLCDEASKVVLRDVMLYRLTSDPSYMAGYSLRDQDQYFDVPRRLADHPVFVDGGAYCGETTEAFIRRHPDYEAVHLFEPTRESMAKAQALLSRYRNLNFHSQALGDVQGSFPYDAEAENASRISSGGKQRVEVATLDGVVDGKVDLIKFDLEGYETRALRGSARIIRESAPELAICVYHHTADFVDVPKTILDIRDDYRLRLGHYTEGWEETVMYFNHLDEGGR